MTKILERICNLGIVGLVLTIFLREFIHSNVLLSLETILLLAVVVICVILAKGIPFYMSIITLTLGHLLVFKYQMGYGIWYEGITKNLPLGVVFVVVPILSIPLRLGGYLTTVHDFVAKYIAKTCSLFFALSGSAFALSSITNLGFIRILHTLVEKVNFPPKFLAKAYSVGFASVIVWSPYFASVNLVLYYTHVKFSSYFLYGFFLGFLLLILGNFLFYRDKNCQLEVKERITAGSSQQVNNKKMLQLLANLLGLFILVIIGEKILKFSSMMLIVSFIAFVYSFLWALFIREGKSFLLSLGNYYRGILGVKNELVFFISVGFFGVVLANTPLQGVIEKVFQGLAGYSTFFVAEVIIIVTSMLSILGIHHVITVTTLGLSLQASVLGLSDIGYALTLVSAYTVSMILSPFAPFNIITGGLTKENSFVVSLRWNLLFGLVAIVVAGGYVTLINTIF